MDGITELAKMFKERENPTLQGICLGEVIAPLPDIQISVNSFILDKDDIVIAQHLLPTYKRTTLPTLTVSSATVGDHGAHTHSVNITDITFTDTLKKGDRVVVIPSTDNTTYFIIDKVGDI
mgnify:CR=1 FL=1